MSNLVTPKTIWQSLGCDSQLDNYVASVSHRQGQGMVPLWSLSLSAESSDIFKPADFITVPLVFEINPGTFVFFFKAVSFFLKLFFECQCCFFINALLICFDALSCFLCCVFGIQHRHRGWGCSTAGWSEAKFARRAELPQRVLFHGLSGGLLLLDSLGPWPIVSLETLLDALF